LSVEGNDEEATLYWNEKSQKKQKKQKKDPLITFPTFVKVLFENVEILFYYLYESNLLTVKSNIDLLSSLYEGDSGKYSPNIQILK
jgi:hypothetical protein